MEQSNFDNPVQTFNVKEGAKITATFNVVSEKKIHTVTSTCGCYSVRFGEKFVTLNYNAGSVPAHLQQIGKAEFNKGTTVHFTDDSTERITIKGTVSK